MFSTVSTIHTITKCPFHNTK